MSTSDTSTRCPALGDQLPPSPQPTEASSSSSSAMALPPLPRLRIPSSFSTPPPPGDAATSSAVNVPYFCPKHVAVAMRKWPPFPLFFFKRCPDCRHGRDLPNNYSAASSSSPSSLSSSPLTPLTPTPRRSPSTPRPRPPSLLDSSEYVLLFSSSSSTVWSVPTETGMTSVTISDSDTTVACAVCTDALPPAATACGLPCGHLYHSDCIVQWLSLRNSCPVCRRRIPMFPDHGTCNVTEETSPSLPPHDPQTTATDHRRRSLPGARWIRRICRRLSSRSQPN